MEKKGATLISKPEKQGIPPRLTKPTDRSPRKKKAQKLALEELWLGISSANKRGRSSREEENGGKDTIELDCCTSYKKT